MKHLFVAGALALAVAAPAQAGTTQPITYTYTNGSGACQGALPAFAGTLRARPLALQNEGGANAFVTCSLESGIEGDVGPKNAYVRVVLRNQSASAVDVTCTLVDGYGTTADYLPKTLTIAANAAAGVGWLPSELPVARDIFEQPNLSCGLPPGVGIDFIERDYYNDVPAA